MIARRCVTSLVVAAIVACAIAVPASAQLTTASVFERIKDPQGAVIPGAAVTLISETLGTQLADVFTNTTGDFVFANVSPDRYTIQIALEGFKTLRRSGIVVSAGDRLGLGALAIEVGTLAETVLVQAETPLVQLQS